MNREELRLGIQAAINARWTDGVLDFLASDPQGVAEALGAEPVRYTPNFLGRWYVGDDEVNGQLREYEHDGRVFVFPRSTA